jgi:hypothetical protein
MERALEIRTTSSENLRLGYTIPEGSPKLGY